MNFKEMRSQMQKEIFNWGNLSRWRDEIYGFSILWIVLFHIFNTFKKVQFKWTIITIFNNGMIGVDIFLFMSGICSYFSFQNNKNVKAFLKKRFIKILKIYLFFCIPFYLLQYLVFTKDVPGLIQDLTFTKFKLSSYWFLLAILICYLLYPLIYKCLENNRQKLLGGGLILYLVFLFAFCTFNKTTFTKYEICLSRFPIFIIGSLLGPYVYEKKAIKEKWYLSGLVFLLSYGPLFYLINRIPFLKNYTMILNRFYLGGAAIGTIFLLNIIFELFTLKNTKKILKYIGGFTLEIYVFHLAFRNFIIDMLKIKFTHVSTIFLFIIFYIIISIGASKILNIILNCKFSKKSGFLQEK